MTIADHVEMHANSLWQKDHAHFLHPWTHFDSFKRDGSLVIDSAEGAYVTDAAGKRYLDGIGGLWCVNIGYGRKEMAQAIAAQVLKLSYSNTFTDCTNEPATELAAKLAELAPGTLNHVAYSVSGSCANDTAIRLAHFYHSRRGEPHRRVILSRYNSYHGSTYLGMTLGNREGDRSPHFHYIDGLVHAWFHLLRSSSVLRGRAQEHRAHRRGELARQRPHGRGLFRDASQGACHIASGG